MKPAQARAIYRDCIERNWQEIDGTLYPPAQAERLQAGTGSKSVKKKSRLKRTYDVHDHLNIANKAKHCDQFTRLLEIELGLTVWPEYYFEPGRKWRIDYAIPEHQIAIEVEGGAFTRGRHTRPKGFIADMEKYNKLSEKGWYLIRLIPSNLLSLSTLQTIKSIISNGKHINIMVP